MSRKRSKCHDYADLESRAKEAAQMAELTALLAGELRGLLQLLYFSRKILKNHFPTHRKLIARLNTLCETSDLHRLNLDVLHKKYAAIVENHRHEYGALEYVSLQGLLNYSISLEQLLEVFPIDTVVEDFLDE